MSDKMPNRKQFIVLLTTIACVTLLYQVVKGWDTVEYLLRLVFVTALALVTRRGGILVSQAYAGRLNPSTVQVACWILAGAALFAGIMTGV